VNLFIVVYFEFLLPIIKVNALLIFSP